MGSVSTVSSFTPASKETGVILLASPNSGPFGFVFNPGNCDDRIRISFSLRDAGLGFWKV